MYNSMSHVIMSILLVLFLLTCGVVHGQNQCTCRCCLGQSCSAALQGTVSVNNCSADACLSQCRCTYPQCAGNYPYGLLLSECVKPLYSCQCLCCLSTTSQCTPTFVGYASTYACDLATCGVECYKQYPTQCGTGPFTGLSASCAGLATTASTTTTASTWLGYACSCYYCPSSFNCGTSGTFIGVASATGCSSNECTLACQNRFPTSICATTYISLISGHCLTETTGRTQCKCNCCGTSACIDYELSTNTTCSTCSSKCSQFSPCTNTRQVTYTCTTSSTTRIFYSSSWNSFFLFVILFFYY